MGFIIEDWFSLVKIRNSPVKSGMPWLLRHTQNLHDTPCGLILHWFLPL